MNPSTTHPSFPAPRAGMTIVQALRAFRVFGLPPLWGGPAEAA